MRIQPSNNQSFIAPYSFQAQEHDDEVKGDGNSVNYKYRMHDPRLGRFFAVDPLASSFPWNSCYAFSENKVIAWGELEGLETFCVIIMPYPGDPLLKMVHIRKSSETTTNGAPIQVDYTNYDSKGNILSTISLDHFESGSVEEFAMNENYQGTSMSNIAAMNVTQIDPTYNVMIGLKKPDGTPDKVNTPVGPSKLVGKICFQYDLKTMFKTNKAQVNKDEIQDGKFVDAMNGINALNKLFGMIIPTDYYGVKGEVDLKTMKMTVNGETDSQVSSPAFPSVDGRADGNESLGQARANNVLQLLKSGHPDYNSTRSYNHTGVVKSEDRNSSVFFTTK